MYVSQRQALLLDLLVSTTERGFSWSQSALKPVSHQSRHPAHTTWSSFQQQQSKVSPRNLERKPLINLGNCNRKTHCVDGQLDSAPGDDLVQAVFVRHCKQVEVSHAH